MRKTGLAIGALGIALLLVAMLTAVATATPGDQVCPPGTSGKIDTSGDPDTVTISVPAGKILTAYCVKAGSANSGYGPEIVSVYVEGPAEFTFGHSSEKAVSHYSYWLEDPSGTTTTTQGETTTTVPETTTTVPETTTTVPETTTTVPETTTTVPETTTTVPETTTTVPETTTTVPETTTTQGETTTTAGETTTTETPKGGVQTGGGGTAELPHTGVDALVLTGVGLLMLLVGALLLNLSGRKGHAGF